MNIISELLCGCVGLSRHTFYFQGTGLDLRPLRSSVSTQGVYFTGILVSITYSPFKSMSTCQRQVTSTVGSSLALTSSRTTPANIHPDHAPYLSRCAELLKMLQNCLSIIRGNCQRILLTVKCNQDLASSSRANPPPSRRPSRGLLDVTNVNINNSEIDKVTRSSFRMKVSKENFAGLGPLHPLSGSPGARRHRGHCCSWGSRQGGILGLSENLKLAFLYYMS